MHKPSWYKHNEILVVNSETCGINKDGQEQYIVDSQTGIRSNTDIDDALGEACEQIQAGNFERRDVNFQPKDYVYNKNIFVPKYYDKSINDGINKIVNDNNNLDAITFNELIQSGLIEITNGHGSPSSDQRIGEIPYIKVSDLRAGSVNINPTNMVPIELAKKFWKDEHSGLRSYDLISPERASKNIGEFCVLMPGQENVVLTREVIVIRAIKNSNFDQFYLMWALSLLEVRKQWERIVFMQTNREDVGDRMLEIIIPFPTSQNVAKKLAEPFKKYYESLENVRNQFNQSLNSSSYSHHIHLGNIS